MNHSKPIDILEATVNAGVQKSNSSLKKLIILGILAGAYIAFAGLSSTLASYGLLAESTTFGLGKALAGTIFAGGLIMVVLAGAELFTGNSLITLAVLEKQATITQMAKNLVVVYISNFIGAIIIVAIAYHIDLFSVGDGLMGAITVKTAVSKVNMTFSKGLLSGILCNWLVCLAVWCATGGKTTIDKVGAIFFPIWIFVICGFEHCVANMYFIPAGIFASSNQAFIELSGVGAEALANLNWAGMFINNMLPVTIGNILGGSIFVAAAYWLALKKS